MIKAFKPNSFQFTAKIAKLSSKFFVDYAVDGYHVKRDQIPSDMTTGIEKWLSKTINDTFLASLYFDIDQNHFDFGFIDSGFNNYTTLVSGHIDDMPYVKLEPINRSLKISRFIESVIQAMHSIYVLPSVQQYIKNQDSYDRKSSEWIELRVSADFNDFADLISKFDLYSESEKAAADVKVFDVIVELNVDRVVDEEGTDKDPVRSSTQYFLALTNEGLEELKQFITKINQRRMARKLSTSAERLM